MTKANSSPNRTHLIGAHVSAAGGLDKAVERAAAIGCNFVQVFSGSPRVWARSGIESIPVDKVFSKEQELGIESMITHAIYLTNVASDNPELVRKSIGALVYDLEFDSFVKGRGVVVHLGSHQGRGWDAVKEGVAKALMAILEGTPENSRLLIENSAGQNGKINSDLSEIRWLMDMVKSPRLGWCLDTCHAHAAGYELGDGYKEAYQVSGRELGPQHRGVLPEEIEKYDLWKVLGCVHVNDSRDLFGSGRDRHANLGDGFIPQEQFQKFLRLPELEKVPFILEVPGLDDLGPDAENVKRLKTLVGVE